MRTEDAIVAVEAVGIEESVHIGARHGLIHKGPDEATGRTGSGPVQLPEIFEGSTSATIILCVQEFGGHVDE